MLSTVPSSRARYADGLFFLQNLRYVHTFITRAELDPVVVSDAIPGVLDWYRLHVNPPPVTQVALDLAPRSGTARPGWITVTYGTLSDIAPGEQRIIRSPTYDDAGHVVSVSSPSDLYADVRDFLQETRP